ncbi:MAG TPA: hypothetical protein VN695_02580 [Streptosporangiaceae bacterium]|nr:hypothetical protein [Streptosporangiaceae bacterium]
MFTIFSTLTKDERLPAIETIEARPWRWLTEPMAGLRRRYRRRHHRTTTQRHRFVNAAFIPFIMLSLLVAVLAVSGQSSSANRCRAVAGYHSLGVANVATPKCGSWLSQANR